MVSKCAKIPLSVSPAFLLFVIFSLFLIPIRFLSSWMFVSLVHELCHYWALRICKCHIESVYIGVGGAKIRTEPLPEWQECFCALAGPFGGMTLTLLGSVTPAVALCAFLQSAYNLLPIYPLDGGRALYSLIRTIFKPDTAERFIVFWTKYVTAAIVLSCVFAAFRWDMGLLPLIVAVIIIIRSKKSLANIGGREYNVFSYDNKRKLNNPQMRYSDNDSTGAYIAFCTETCPVHRRRI